MYCVGQNLALNEKPLKTERLSYRVNRATLQCFETINCGFDIKRELQVARHSLHRHVFTMLAVKASLVAWLQVGSVAAAMLGFAGTSPSESPAKPSHTARLLPSHVRPAHRDPKLSFIICPQPNPNHKHNPKPNPKPYPNPYPNLSTTSAL